MLRRHHPLRWKVVGSLINLISSSFFKTLTRNRQLFLSLQLMLPTSPKISSSIQPPCVPPSIPNSFLASFPIDTNLIGNKYLILLDKFFNLLKNLNKSTLITKTIFLHLNIKYFRHICHLTMSLCHLQ